MRWRWRVDSEPCEPGRLGMDRSRRSSIGRQAEVPTVVQLLHEDHAIEPAVRSISSVMVATAVRAHLERGLWEIIIVSVAAHGTR